ncbi:TPA: hypothetical protein ACY4RU_001539 [Clostridium perfringens]|nr:hypothetical protein [Clostridium perfringens]MDK0757295.1 hypothetical protein [Clostridium perfringens]
MNKIIERILDENKKIKLLYKNINEKLESQGKKLNIILESIDNGDFGKTYNTITEVLIIIDLSLKDNKEKLKAVFIHELGEADYIANKLPVIYLNEKFFDCFTECITHSHINKIIKKYNLEDEVKENLKPYMILNQYDDIIKLLHYKITYSLNDTCMESKFNSYSKYKELINEIIIDIEKFDTININDKKVLDIEKRCSDLIEKIEQNSNYDKLELKSNLNNKVLFLNNNLNFEMKIDTEICKTILSNINKLDNIKISVDYDNIEVNGLFNSELEMSDTYRYKVSFQDGYAKLINIINENENLDFMKKSDYDEYPVSYEKDIKSIVIILESPHANEYEKFGNKLEIKGPAQGTTGKKIEENIIMLLNQLKINYKYSFSDNIYRIILINSICYQTSINSLHGHGLSGKKNKKYNKLRDDVWRILWSKDIIKESFKKRVKDANPYLIINACTKVGKDEINKVLVEEEYENIVKTNHPCSWNGFGINLYK